MMKLIHGIEGYANKVKIEQLKSKLPNLGVLKYIKGEKYLDAEVGKYVYSVIEGKSREGRQYVWFQLPVAHEVTWDN